MFEVTKSDRQHFMTGLVLEPDTVDAQLDVVTRPEVEKACHSFNENGWNLWKDHLGPMPQEQARIVESYITEAPMTLGGRGIKAGSWLIKVAINEDLYNAAQDGMINGFSIGGEGSHEEA